MKTTNIKTTCLLSVLMLGAAVSASAQTSLTATPDPVTIDPGPGLVGTDYTELSFGYQKQSGTPSDLRDYEFISNGASYRQGIWGADANFKYDFTQAGAAGFDDRRNEAQFGATGYMTQSWGKPFLTGDLGMAWEHVGGTSRKSVAYTVDAGVQFEVLKNLVVSPYIEYDGEPHLYNHAPAVANFPDHVIDLGVKATYRITRHWNASLGASVDQYSGEDLGARAGVSYRF
jgi:opacity protein-like surface antigen